MAFGKKGSRKTRSTAAASSRSRNASHNGSTRNSTRNSYYDDDFDLEEEEEDEETGNLEDAAIEEAEEVTRCLCGNDDLKLDPKDKYYKNEAVLGLFIQCEKCNAWQHGYCVGIYEDTPELKKYWCEQCRLDLHHVSADGKLSKYLPMQPKKRNSNNSTNEKKRSASYFKRNNNSSSETDSNTSSNTNNLITPDNLQDSSSAQQGNNVANESEISVTINTRSSRSKRTTLNSNDAILEKVLKESAREYNRKHHHKPEDEDDIKFKELTENELTEFHESSKRKTTKMNKKDENNTEDSVADLVTDLQTAGNTSELLKKETNLKDQDTSMDVNSADTTATCHTENTTAITNDITIDNNEGHAGNKNISNLNYGEPDVKSVTTRSRSKNENSANSSNKNSEKEESVTPATTIKSSNIDHDETDETPSYRRGRSLKKRSRRAAAANNGFGSAEDTGDASSSNELPELTYNKKRTTNGNKKKRQAATKTLRNGATVGPNSGHANSILDSDRPIEPRIPSLKITLHEMRKRITAISEFIYYVSADMIDEQRNYKELMSTFSGGATSNGNSANSSIITSDDDIEDDKFIQGFERFFENSSSNTLILIDELKNKIQNWEESFGSWS